MLRRSCFGKPWIEEQSRFHGVGNTFFEKMLYAFELLGRLAQEGLDFVFKGGTSLMLRLPEPKRLSIDVDIVCRESGERLERLLKHCATDPFVGLVEDERRHNHPPRRRHWNFRFHSVNPQGCPEPYIILDVLEEDVLYTDLEALPIQTRFFVADHPVTVRVPTVDNLLADKLTAFAPETIGQEYNEEHPEKMAKHLFDIGELFNAAESIHAVRDVYRRIAEAEIGYRKEQKIINLDECLEDTIRTARLVAGLVLNQEPDAERSPLLRRGIKELSGHLVGADFGVREAAVAAGKAALLASLIQRDDTSQSFAGRRYDPTKTEALRNIKIIAYPEFAKLAQASPESFHYWSQVRGA